MPPERLGEKDFSVGESDTHFNVSEELREVFEAEGRRLEGYAFVAGPPSFIVITCRVDYGDRPSFETSQGVIKFSMREHALADSKYIQLGSSRYYREYEGAIEGVADPEEARLEQRGSLGDILKKSGLSPQTGFENVSSTVTWARPDFLTFCTSIAAEGRALKELWDQFRDYDCATLIADPSAFALQLGKDIGRQLDALGLRLSGFDKMKRIMLTQAEIRVEGHLFRKGLDAVVFVSHGPVRYCDPPEEVVNRYPIERRGELVPFVKRVNFEGHREYRFVVEVIGEPKEKLFLMEITDELRRLARTLE